MAFVKRRLRNVKPRVMENADGKLWKRCDVKVIVQGKIQPHKFVAPAGRGYSEKDIEDIRERCIDYLDKRFPHFEFKEVQIAPNAFNYIATELRGGQSPQEFMNDQAKRFDPEAFVASVRSKGGSGAGTGTAAENAGDKSNDENGGSTAAGADGRAEDRSEPAESAAGSGESADPDEPAASSNRERGVPESGPSHSGDPEPPEHAV